MINKKIIGVIACLFLSLVLVGFVSAENIIITECTTINESGDYVLGSDVVQNVDERCMIINANDVTLDCQGYSITSDFDKSGIFSDKDYTSVRNCNINVGEEYVYVPGVGGYLGAGIKIEYSEGAIIEDNVLNNGYIGLLLLGTDNSIVRNNVANSNSEDGIFLSSSSNSYLENNNVNNNGDNGIYVHSATIGSSNNNILINSVANFNGDNGILFYSNSVDYLNNNLVDGATLLSNGASGLNSGNQYNSTFLNIISKNNDAYGVVLISRYISSNSVFLNNCEISENGAEDILAISSSSPTNQGQIFDVNILDVDYSSEKITESYSSAIIERKWTHQTRVVDSTGNPIADANVEIRNALDEIIYIGTTDSEGNSEIVELIEYVNNGEGITSHNPYTIIITKEGYVENTFEYVADSVGNSVVVLEAVPVAAPNPNITSCMTINETGDYILMEDIVADKSKCIEVFAENVVIDCAGHSITSDEFSSAIYAGDLADGLTVKNCNIDMKTGAGIYLKGVNGGRIVDNVVSGQWHGLYMVDVTDTGILGNDFGGNHYHGIYGRNSDGNVIMNNNIVKTSGRGIMLQKDSDNNTITANYIERAIHGIMISESDYTLINSNTIVDSWNDAFSFYRSYGNVVEDNVFEIVVPAPVVVAETQIIETQTLTTEPLTTETSSIESTLDPVPVITNMDYEFKKLNRRGNKRKVVVSVDFEDDDVKKVMYKINNGKWKKFCSTKGAADGNCARGKYFKVGKDYTVNFKVVDKEGNKVKDSVEFSV